jgi:hypothetical protein
MLVETTWGREEPSVCQDCVGIGRVWIQGLLQDCPECGGRGWQSMVALPGPQLATIGAAPAPSPDYA